MGKTGNTKKINKKNTEKQQERSQKHWILNLLCSIAGVGVLVTVISQILTRAGREDIATMTTIAGLVIVLMMVVTLVAELLSNVQSIFGLY